MGCGGTQNRGAGSPVSNISQIVADPSWELKGKLPLVVLQGWARALGIPFISPNRRTKKESVARHQIRQPFANAEPLELHLEKRLQEDTGKTAVTELYHSIRTAQPPVDNGVTNGKEIEVSGTVLPAVPLPGTAEVPVSNPPVVSPPAESLSQDQSGSVSPLPPPQIPDESSDEDVNIESEAIRHSRLAKEEEAERQAARLAAEQRAEMEKQQVEQGLLMDAQKNQADAILSKYA